MIRKPLPIGIDSFRRLRENDYYYTDKSMLIADWMADGAQVTLITRPRRFGKTLNLDMVKEFFDINADSHNLFEGLAIMDTPWKEEINSRPVIFLSFRNCKDMKLNLLKLLKSEILREYEQFPKAFQSLAGSQKATYQKIFASLVSGDEDWLSVNESIAFLIQTVSQFYKKNSILLIDEYDTPMASAYSEGYYEDLRPLFTSLYATALKGNPCLDRGLLTGIQRIAKESIFSGLNNLLVCTVKDRLYSPYFGFDEGETAALLQSYELELTEGVKTMYDGYRFGAKDLYNPWSLLNYAKTGELVPYWVNTSSNALIRQSILKADTAFFRSFEELILGGSTEVAVLLDTSFFELSNNATLWGMLLNAGYLTQAGKMDPLTGFCEVCIPNLEVRREFQVIVAQYTKLGETSLAEMFHYLVSKRNIPAFLRAYREIVMTATSFHDAKENAYHMLMLGMCIYLDQEYEIASNLESGHGRSDITLKAKRPGLLHIIMEFKQGDNPEQLCHDAMKQIEDKQYYSGLYGEILLMGIAHRVKECAIETKIIQIQR